MANVRVNVKDQRIKDLLCNAFEGGSNYWYFIESFNYPEGKTENDYEFPHIDLPLADGGSLTIKSLEEPDKPMVTLDRKACLKGLSIMAKDYPRHFADFMSEDDDAITADVFLQCTCYGEVIYG
jgi:hypothetical protein